MNHYVLLGVSPDATRATIRQAFRVLVRQYHPDAGTGASVDRFREIINAYETLSDPVRRQAYDRSLGVPQLQQQVWSREPLVWPSTMESRIPDTPLSVVTTGRSAPMHDVFLTEMFAEDLFATIDRLLFPPRR